MTVLTETQNAIQCRPLLVSTSTIHVAASWPVELTLSISSHESTSGSELGRPTLDIISACHNKNLGKWAGDRQSYLIDLVYLFLAALCDLQDLNSPTRDQTLALCSESMES